MSENTPRRRPVARHGQLKSPSAVGQLFKIIGIVLAVVLVSGVGVSAFVFRDLTANYAEAAVDLDGQGELPPNISAYEQGFNLLLVGTDTCEPEYAAWFGDRCTGPDAEGTLNDVNLLVHVSEEPRRVTAVSLPRDLMVAIPGCGDYENWDYISYKEQINAAYTYGGLNCVARTVTELTGQSIDFAAAITFGGVIEVTNAIGGVEVCLASGIRDVHTGIDWEAGNRTVSGIEALQFLRTRYGVGDGSDVGRIGNQQQYMSSLVRKMLSSDVMGHFPTLLSLTRTVLDNVTPSQSMTNPVLLGQIALALKDVAFEDIVFLQYPTFTDFDDPNRLVPDWNSAEVMWEAINANQPLEVTYENTENDGVIVVEAEPAPEEPDASADSGDETEGAGEATASPEPTEGAVALPSTIRGNNAATVTCSNGNVRDW